MNNFSLKAIAQGVAASAFLATSCMVTAAGLPVTVNGAACGTYTAANFNAQGHLALSAVLTCGSGTNPVDPNPVDPNPVDPNPVDPNPVDPNPVDPAPVACGTPPANGWGTRDHVWSQNLAANARAPVSLSGLQVYSLKLIDEKNDSGQPVSKGLGGYGVIKTYDLPGNIATRTVVISECPNSMVPAAAETVPGYNPCISSGSTTTTVRWTHQKNNTNITQCSLDPAKQYYVNVQHVAAPSSELTCKAASCSFLFDYTLTKKL